LPKRKKTKIGQADTGISEASDRVVELDKAVKVDCQKYMEGNVAFSTIDDEECFHAKFSELVQDAGVSELRSLLLVHAMERKHEALDEKYKDSSKDVEKFKH